MNSISEKRLTIHQHFSKIAHKYHHLRTTDLEPIRFIVKRIRKLKMIEAMDIGCGAGRYDVLLFKYLESKLRLTCADANSDMLNSLVTNLTSHNISNFTTVIAEAEKIPSPDSSYDCIFTFNAVHHFKLREFLLEIARILKVGGRIFVYTRTPDQNMKSIWGRYFPMFNKKETRLYTLNQFVKTVETVPDLQLKSIEYYKYGRKSNLGQLIERVRAHHYSTFFLYSPEELEESISGFTSNIKSKFKDETNVNWFDENIMYVLNKK